MDINGLTIGEALEITAMFGTQAATGMLACIKDEGPWEVGQSYHIRTVTNYWTGRLTHIYEQEIVIEDACWIADTGRFSDFFKEGPGESEPVNGEVIIGRGAIVDAQIWSIALPRSQK